MWTPTRMPCIYPDGGLTWLAEADRELSLCEAITSHVPEWRGPSVRHPLVRLVRQRVFQIACGYEDQNDSNTLRNDTLLKLACGSLPETEGNLASQATISRFENAPDGRACLRIARALGELYVRERGKGGAPERILLEFDSTDDPAYGDHGGAFYHGFYVEHIYHPLHVFDGQTGQLITAGLRAGNTHSSRSAIAILKRIVVRLREAWLKVEIEIRADAGFAVPEVYEYCEERIDYTIGLICNPRLEALAQDLLERAKREYEAKAQQEKERLVSSISYRALSWEHPRRVVYKTEVLQKGTNARFVVTSRSDEPKRLYNSYVRRGEADGWIKDFKLALKADRLSCH
jgi:Transposase DDE domain group 1